MSICSAAAPGDRAMDVRKRANFRLYAVNGVLNRTGRRPKGL